MPTPTPPLALPALPEPYRAASTIKCLSCGAPYEPARALAPHAAQNFYSGAMSSGACKCGSKSFQGTVGYDSPSPAQFTADQMNAHATAAILSDRAGRGDAAGWVSVEDRLPEVDERCIYYFDAVGMHIGEHHGDGCFGGRSGFLGGREVTHWQPLPTPPAAPTGEAS